MSEQRIQELEAVIRDLLAGDDEGCWNIAPCETLGYPPEDWCPRCRAQYLLRGTSVAVTGEQDSGHQGESSLRARNSPVAAAVLGEREREIVTWLRHRARMGHPIERATMENCAREIEIGLHRGRVPMVTSGQEPDESWVTCPACAGTTYAPNHLGCEVCNAYGRVPPQAPAEPPVSEPLAEALAEWPARMKSRASRMRSALAASTSDDTPTPPTDEDDTAPVPKEEP